MTASSLTIPIPPLQRRVLTMVLLNAFSMTLLILALSLMLGSADTRPQTYPRLEQTTPFSLSVAALLCLAGLVLSMLRGRVHTQTSGDRI